MLDFGRSKEQAACGALAAYFAQPKQSTRPNEGSAGDSVGREEIAPETEETEVSAGGGATGEERASHGMRRRRRGGMVAAEAAGTSAGEGIAMLLWRKERESGIGKGEFHMGHLPSRDHSRQAD